MFNDYMKNMNLARTYKKSFHFFLNWIHIKYELISLYLGGNLGILLMYTIVYQFVGLVGYKGNCAFYVEEFVGLITLHPQV